MRLYLFAFGKLKTPGLRSAADTYIKMLKPWVSFEEIELKPQPVPEKSTAARALIQNKEDSLLVEKLSSRLTSRGCFYLLDERGKNLPTRKWADLVRECEDGGIPEIAFCVGSSLGFSSELRKKARGVISLGEQTLPHELARVVLLEQLYRSWSVVRGHPYHNE